MDIKLPSVSTKENQPHPVVPTPSEIAEGYRQFIGDEVDFWHFPMMNDSVRNSGYEKALGAAIKKGDVVLDIGTGSGLLAMLAIRQGASRVITCEEIPMIARKAQEIIRLNGYSDRIQIINKRSTSLVVGKDFPERADVLVTEIFDDGLLGEGAFVAIEHARLNLLKTNARVIPSGVRVLAMCIESQEVFENHRVTQVAGFDVSPFNEFSLQGYTGYHLDKMKYRPLSIPQAVFNFDFCKLPPDESIPIEFEINSAGCCHAIAFWYELQMDEKTIVSTAPGLPKLSSWKQAILLFENPRSFKCGDRYSLKAHHDKNEIWFT